MTVGTPRTGRFAIILLSFFVFFAAPGARETFNVFPLSRVPLGDGDRVAIRTSDGTHYL